MSLRVAPKCSLSSGSRGAVPSGHILPEARLKALGVLGLREVKAVVFFLVSQALFLLGSPLSPRSHCWTLRVSRLPRFSFSLPVSWLGSLSVFLIIVINVHRKGLTLTFPHMHLPGFAVRPPSTNPLLTSWVCPTPHAPCFLCFPWKYRESFYRHVQLKLKKFQLTEKQTKEVLLLCQYWSLYIQIYRVKSKIFRFYFFNK